MIYFAIEKAKKNNIKNICVSTESDKISNIVKKQGSKVFLKDRKVCVEEISKLLVWKDAIIESLKSILKKF